MLSFDYRKRFLRYSRHYIDYSFPWLQVWLLLSARKWSLFRNRMAFSNTQKWSNHCCLWMGQVAIRVSIVRVCFEGFPLRGVSSSALFKYLHYVIYQIFRCSVQRPASRCHLPPLTMSYEHLFFPVLVSFHIIYRNVLLCFFRHSNKQFHFLLFWFLILTIFCISMFQEI